MHHKITLIAFSETGARVNLVLKSVFRERQHKLSITTKGHGKGGWELFADSVGDSSIAVIIIPPPLPPMPSHNLSDI